MARTRADIEDEMQSVRAAMAAMECTEEGSVGLRNVLDLGGRVEQGMRPSYDALARRLKELEQELASLSAHRGRIFVTRYDKGISR